MNTLIVCLKRRNLKLTIEEHKNALESIIFCLKIMDIIITIILIVLYLFANSILFLQLYSDYI